jgi:GntR family transcriptional regulator, transcriptional repressor for pyruvate dehydrogenase complex
MSNRDPLVKRKTALIVAQRIVRDIKRHGLAPGDSLPHEALMREEYAVGRGTLRESLRYLELQGAIRLKTGPGGGPVVDKPGVDALSATLSLLLQFDGAPYRVIAEARVAFEPLMAQLAAERIRPEQLAELEQSLVDMEKGLLEDEEYLDSNNRFHDAIARASGNSLFAYLVGVMVGSMDLNGSTHGIEYPPARRRAVLQAHRTIYDAVASGDADKAGESMRTHIGEYMTYMQRRYPRALDDLITWE